MYVYIKSEPGLWTVGFYRPDGKWEPESDHSSPDAAGQRVHFLNGGKDAEENYPEAFDVHAASTTGNKRR